MAVVKDMWTCPSIRFMIIQTSNEVNQGKNNFGELANPISRNHPHNIDMLISNDLKRIKRKRKLHKNQFQ